MTLAFRPPCPPSGHANPPSHLHPRRSHSFGPCDDYMTVLKSNSAQTAFTATVRLVSFPHTFPSRSPWRLIPIHRRPALTHTHCSSLPPSPHNQAAAKEDGTGTALSASVPLTVANAGQGLYVVFENLLGAPVTFTDATVRPIRWPCWFDPIRSNETDAMHLPTHTCGNTPHPPPHSYIYPPTRLQVTANGVKAFDAGKDLVFPAATVHLSAAVVKLGSSMVRACLSDGTRDNARRSRVAPALIRYTPPHPTTCMHASHDRWTRRT